MPGREISLVAEVLELQVLDREARPVGRVDDLELAEDGRSLVALLVGGDALAGRLGGPIGRAWAAAYRRLHDDRRGTGARIALEDIVRVDSRVDLSVARDDLGIGSLDDWLNQRIIDRIPGSNYAPE